MKKNNCTSVKDKCVLCCDEFKILLDKRVKLKCNIKRMQNTTVNGFFSGSLSRYAVIVGSNLT